MTTVTPGDVWTLRWDGTDLATAMVVQAHDSFAVVWPVTSAAHSSPPALAINDEHQSLGAALWPTRPTGIGNHLLGTYLGTLLSQDAIDIISDEMEDPEAELTVLPLATGTYDADADRAFIDEWNGYCFHTGKPAGQHWLRTDKLTSSRVLATALNLGVVQTRPYWDGVLPLTDEQLTALIQATGLSSGDLTGPDPYAAAEAHLSSPAFKEAVEARVAETGLSEEQVRMATREEFALAARDDSASRIDEKLRDALSRVDAP